MTDMNHDLEQIADGIIADSTTESRIVSAVAEGGRLTAGLEREDSRERIDPGRYLDKADKSAGALMPADGKSGASSHPRYVTSAGISHLDHQVHEARRRDEDAELGETQAAAKAWTDFVAAADEARRLVRDIPLAMRRAEIARADALADPGESPVALPSVADSRAHAEAVAGKALRHALDLRRRYDGVVEETAGDRLESLSSSVPAEAAAIVERVSDLKAAVVALRAGVRTLTHAAGAETGRCPRSLPTAVRLEVLDDLEAEVGRLAEVAAEPSEAVLRPSLRERALIHRQSLMAVGSITAATIDLARTEKSEGYKHTQYTRGIPEHVLDNAAAQAQY